MRLTYHVFIIFFAITFVSCGGGEKKKEKIKIQAKETKSTIDTNVAKLVISGNDMMKFDKNELRVKAGQKVKLTLRHTGKIDVNVMGHNVVILNTGVDVNAFAAKAAVSKATDYIPQDALSEIVAYTGLIGGGQITSIEFDAPSTGTYDFICSFPGHVALMKGKFIVE